MTPFTILIEVRREYHVASVRFPGVSGCAPGDNARAKLPGSVGLEHLVNTPNKPTELLSRDPVPVKNF